MARRFFIAAGLVTLAGLVSATTVEATAEFKLDNVLATKRVTSGETVTVVRDAAWAEGGVTFSMTGASDEVLTEGASTSLVIPDVPHCKVITLGLKSGEESFSYAYLVVNGMPNREADTTATFALDSRTGTVRDARDQELVSYSDRWTVGGVGPTVAVTAPDGTVSSPVCAGEGLYAWGVARPYAAKRLVPGVYTFSHQDGNEELVARFRVADLGCIIVFR